MDIPTPKYVNGQEVLVKLKAFYAKDYTSTRKGSIVDTHIHINRDGGIIVRYNVQIPDTGCHGFREEEILEAPELSEYE